MKGKVSLRKLIHMNGLLQELSFGEELLERNRPFVHNRQTAVVSYFQHHLKKILNANPALTS